MNEENIKKYNEQRSTNEARENGKKGGVASGQSRRRKKYLKDTVNMLLALPIHPGSLNKLDSLETINDKNVTVEERLVLKQIEKALKGDPKAFSMIMALVADRTVQADVSVKTDKANDTGTFIKALNGAAEVWYDEKNETDTV